jgi:hypothetical protein
MKEINESNFDHKFSVEDSELFRANILAQMIILCAK